MEEEKQINEVEETESIFPKEIDIGFNMQDVVDDIFGGI